jgi:CubicO group peptidase (beta-lactamase class C family)
MKQTISHLNTFLDSWLSYRTIHANDVVGYSVAVLMGKETTFSRAYGMADSQTETPMTSQHLFNVASQTKMMTSILCLQFIEQGLLELDAPVEKYLPWLSQHHNPAIQKVTIRHLLSHSSGLPREGQPADFWLFKTPFPSRVWSSA